MPGSLDEPQRLDKRAWPRDGADRPKVQPFVGTAPASTLRVTGPDGDSNGAAGLPLCDETEGPRRDGCVERALLTAPAGTWPREGSVRPARAIMGDVDLSRCPRRGTGRRTMCSTRFVWRRTPSLSRAGGRRSDGTPGGTEAAPPSSAGGLRWSTAAEPPRRRCPLRGAPRLPGTNRAGFRAHARRARCRGLR